MRRHGRDGIALGADDQPGTRTVEKLFVVLHGVIGTEAFSDGLSRAAISEPPPPIE